MNILFLNVGRRCELVRAFRSSLTARGGGVIFGTDIDPHAPGMHYVDRAEVFPHSSDDSFVERLNELENAHDIRLLIPTIDPDLELLAAKREEIESRCPNLRMLLSRDETIQATRNKRLCRERFAALGAEVPEAVDINTADLEFPIFMKPEAGSSSKGIGVLRSQKELEPFRGRDDLMFEQLVTGPEVTVDVLCDFAGEPLIAIPRRRIMTRGGEVSRGIVERNAELEALAMRLAKGLGCMGPVTVQFRMPAPGRFVAMELNARVGGGLPLSIAAGADWPGWILDLCTGVKPDLNRAVEDGLMMSRYDESVFIHTKTSVAPAPVSLDGIKAVIVDLDDTLYPERDFVMAGFRAVARRIFTDHGVEIEDVLRKNFDCGLRRDAFGAALREVGLEAEEAYVRRLVAVYRGDQSPLEPFSDIAVLETLRQQGMKIGLLTDGWGHVQEAKVKRLGIENLFDSIVYTDRLGGRDFWKPSTAPFEACLKQLDVAAREAIYIGDNPRKDFRGAKALEMRTFRLRRACAEHCAAEALSLADTADAEISSLAALLSRDSSG